MNLFLKKLIAEMLKKKGVKEGDAKIEYIKNKVVIYFIEKGVKKPFVSFYENEPIEKIIAKIM